MNLLISANDEDKAYNGQFDRLEGLSVLGIEHSKNNMVGRGALLEPSGIPPPTRPPPSGFELTVSGTHPPMPRRAVARLKEPRAR